MTCRSMIKINELTCRTQRIILLLYSTQVTIQDGPTSNLKLACQDQIVYLIDHTFYGFTGVITQRDVGRTREELANHELKASDLQAFLMFAQHPKWVIMPVNQWKLWSIAFIKKPKFSKSLPAQ